MQKRTIQYEGYPVIWNLCRRKQLGRQLRYLEMRRRFGRFLVMAVRFLVFCIIFSRTIAEYAP